MDQAIEALAQGAVEHPTLAEYPANQKMGEPDYAVATWLMGAQKFPGHPSLQQKARGN